MWSNVVIVPVSRLVNDDGSASHYVVPASTTDISIRSRPKLRASNIESKFSDGGCNCRRIIKMGKHWNKLLGGYLQGYHTELRALKDFGAKLDDTPWHVFQLFEKARPLLTSTLWHELGHADSYLSWSERQEVRKRFYTALIREAYSCPAQKKRRTNRGARRFVRRKRQTGGGPAPAPRGDAAPAGFFAGPSLSAR
jgi:hypothetical protein